MYMPFFTLSRQTMAVARSVMRSIPSRHHLIPVRSQHWILTVSVGTRNRMTLATCLADHLELTSKGSHIDLPLHRLRLCLIKWAIQVTQAAGSTASQIHLGHSPKQILSTDLIHHHEDTSAMMSEWHPQLKVFPMFPQRPLCPTEILIFVCEKKFLFRSFFVIE